MRISRAGLVSLVFVLCSRLAGGDQVVIGTGTSWAERDEWQQQLQRALDLELQGDFAGAERALLASVHRAEQPNSDPLWLPTALDRLGGFNRHLGRSRQAEHLYLRAADLWQTRFGSNSLGLAMTLSDLAWVCVGLRELSRAESLWRHSLEIRMATFGADHPAVARVYGYMAVGAFAAQRLHDAESFCREALRIYERAGKIPGETDQVLSSLASVRLRQGRASEAIQLSQEAIELNQTAKHSSTRLLGGYYYNLALAESAAARAADAEAHFRRALSLLAGAPSASQTLRCNILDSYAGFLARAGRKEEARTVRKQAASVANAIGRERYAEDVIDVLAFR